MNRVKLCSIVVCVVLLALAVSASAQIYRYYSPATVWTVTTIKMKSGMDQRYLGYLDGPFKRETEALVKAGYMKSYRIWRSLDDDQGWNLLILREYQNLAALEANEAKADEVIREVSGDDEKQMKGYDDRSQFREVLGTKTVREFHLK